MREFVTAANNLAIASLNLSSAQILALNATPVTVVPAPGAGFAIVPAASFGSLTFATGQYASAGSLRLKFGATVAQTLTNCTAAILAAASSVGYDGDSTLGATAVATLANVALTVDASAAITTGAGTFRLTVAYYVAQT